MEPNKDRNEIYSQRVKAGKRTYFFDVRETRAGDRYLTITESKRKFKEGEEGFFYEKHKLFLYKEDFEKFSDALIHTIDHIKNGLPPMDENKQEITTSSAETTEPVEEETTKEDTQVEEVSKDADTELTWD